MLGIIYLLFYSHNHTEIMIMYSVNTKKLRINKENFLGVNIYYKHEHLILYINV
jgi:hypothetical protein